MPPSDPAAIARVVTQACPLQAELLGPSVVSYLLQGGGLTNAPGGRHIDLNTASQTVMAVAAVVQLVWTMWPRQPDPQGAALVTLVEEIARQRVAADTNLTRVLNTDPALLQRIVQALQHEQQRQGE